MPYRALKSAVIASRTTSIGGPSTTTLPSCCAALTRAAIAGVSAACAADPKASRQAISASRILIAPFSLAGGGDRVEPVEAVRGEGDDLVLGGIADERYRITALLDNGDLLVQQLAEHDDAAIAGAEQLLAAVQHRSLCLPGHAVLAVEIVEAVIAVLVVIVGHDLDRHAGLRRHRLA